MSLYLGKSHPIWWQPGIEAAIGKAQANNASFITCSRLLNCVGTAIRTDFIPYIVNSPQQPHAYPIDEHITEVATRYLPQPAVAYTFPSLVDHADTPSVIRQHNDGMPRPPGRKAWLTGPRSHWDSTTVELTAS